MTKTEKAIQWMEQTANSPAHGYDQAYRWGQRGDYDCSSAVITAWQNAGVPVKTKGATYTGNMRRVFLQCGFIDVTNKVNLKTGAGLQRGDVLLNSAHHTAMYCGNGKEVEASINEKGKATGGTPGDQTGREFWIRSYRNYPWNYVLRYKENVSRETSGGGAMTPIQYMQAAIDAMRGKYGNGTDRTKRLKNAGYNPDKVQRLINEAYRK